MKLHRHILLGSALVSLGALALLTPTAIAATPTSAAPSGVIPNPAQHMCAKDHGAGLYDVGPGPVPPVPGTPGSTSTEFNTVTDPYNAVGYARFKATMTCKYSKVFVAGGFYNSTATPAGVTFTVSVYTRAAGNVPSATPMFHSTQPATTTACLGITQALWPVTPTNVCKIKLTGGTFMLSGHVYFVSVVANVPEPGTTGDYWYWDTGKPYATSNAEWTSNPGLSTCFPPAPANLDPCTGAPGPVLLFQINGY